MTTTDQGHSPDLLAEQWGIPLATHAGGEKGRRFPDGTISLRADLGPINRRCTLAHELGHHAHDDHPTDNPTTQARNEHRADRWAAQLLIHPDAYREAETMFGPHPGAIAAHLGVTHHLLAVWRDTHERTTPS
ncbi:MAG TPA: ImmA/IrrE family metallo-endopeptidase [Corynebacterium variabile]|uniref:ImmA/IrrE family metallo-endopeptidase n=1 Tax=Corynebacterium variabile TaxID=1727 RepID=A0A3B9QTG5_9CORY|nr:ImmA/IrrE family metallo-endopeptidase [Corynebacterium variabile]